MSVQPLYSVVVTTYNRAATLRGAIDSLLELGPNSPPHEIIVVDNNSTDDTRAVVEAFLPAAHGRLRYVFEARQGASYGRNAGVAAAHGEFVVFTDDDVRVSPAWLAAIAAVFDAHPEMDYTGGPIRAIWPSEPPEWLTDWFWSPLALVDYGAEGAEVRRMPFRCLVSANLAVRRAAFEAVGGFDPRYQHAPGAVTASEDHELQIRLLDAGYRGWYDPSIEIHAEVQPHRLTLAYHRKWAFDHGRAVVRMTPPRTVFDGHTLFAPEPPAARRFLGAPLWMYRELMTLAVAYLKRLVPGRQPDRLWLQFKILERYGMIHEYARTRRDRLAALQADGSMSTPRESMA